MDRAMANPIDSVAHSSPTWSDQIVPNLQPNLLNFGIPNVANIFLSAEKIYLVSDGSFLDHNGGYAAVLTTNNQYIAHTNEATPYVHDLNTSFRTEAYEMLSGLAMLEKIFKALHTTLPSACMVYAYSDSESLIKCINKNRHNRMTIKSFYGPDVDLITQILSMAEVLTSMHIHLIWEHVK